MKQTHLDTLRQILSAETAPFREDAVIRAVDNWATRRNLEVQTDRFGNLSVRLRRVKGAKRPRRWIFQAHMDHPGFVTVGQTGRIVQAEFRGGVQPDYFRAGTKVRLFGPDGPLKAVLQSRQQRKGRFPLCRIELTGAGKVPDGTVGMWDLPAMQIRTNRLISRACDDLVGSAALLCVLDELRQTRRQLDLTVWLTRGEEAGFVGATAAVQAGLVPDRSALVSVETSRALPGAQLGDGVVIRVGDRTSVFTPAVTNHLAATAAELARTDENFSFVRQLMTGGTCESTVFSLAGLLAGALCLPLGNYHNMGPKHKIGAERIDLRDLESLIKLLSAVAVTPPPQAAQSCTLPPRLLEICDQRRNLL
ncbi:MAG: M20/M25/M40 family metallo-hydrolase [Phycisphaerae bacterium]